MANAGGGVIVYGVEETDKSATGRHDVGEFGELHERALHNAAIAAITPPILGLVIRCFGEPGNRAVVVVIPASLEGPHLIYKNDYFAAPIRNNADTVWMKERQIEAMYRARFDEQRHATEALDALYNEAAAGRDIDERAWLIAVAHPRLPVRARTKYTRDEARVLFQRASEEALVYAGGGGIHPLKSVNELNPRPGLRRWIAVNEANTPMTRWKEAWASIHHDGSVTIATAIGGHRSEQRGETLPGDCIEAEGIECAVADLMGLIRVVAGHSAIDEHEVRIGIEWSGGTPLIIEALDPFGAPRGVSIPLARYTPVEVTVSGRADGPTFLWQVHDLAEDCVNQGGIPMVTMIAPPPRAQ